ncbi:MAG: hypothetical protein ACFB6S_09990 [Geminicoccaceae bacterium]
MSSRFGRRAFKVPGLTKARIGIVLSGLAISAPAMAAEQAIRSSVTDDRGRLAIEWADPVAADVDQAGSTLTLTLSQPVSAAWDQSLESLEPFVSRAERDESGRRLILGLNDGVSAARVQAGPTVLALDFRLTRQREVPALVPAVRVGTYSDYQRIALEFERAMPYRISRAPDQLRLSFEDQGPVDTNRIRNRLASRGVDARAETNALILSLGAQREVRDFTLEQRRIIVLDIIQEAKARVEAARRTPVLPVRRPSTSERARRGDTRAAGTGGPDARPDQDAEMLAPMTALADGEREDGLDGTAGSERVEVGAETPPEPVSDRPEGDVSLVFTADADGVDMVVIWDRAARAALFERAGYLWLAFDLTSREPPRMLGGAAPLGRWLGAPQVVEADRGTVLRFARLGARSFRIEETEDGRRWTIRAQRALPAGNEPEREDLNAERSAPEIKEAGILVARGASPSRVTDPLVGDRLVIMPVPIDGVQTPDRIQRPSFTLLPTHLGAVLTPRTTELVTEVHDQGVVIGAPSLGHAPSDPPAEDDTDENGQSRGSAGPDQRSSHDVPDHAPGSELASLTPTATSDEQKAGGSADAGSPDHGDDAGLADGGPAQAQEQATHGEASAGEQTKPPADRSRRRPIDLGPLIGLARVAPIEPGTFARRLAVHRLATSSKPLDQRAGARLNLVRFYLGAWMPLEALGVLEAIRADAADDTGPPMDPELADRVDGLTAIALLQEGKGERALELFRRLAGRDDPELTVWQAKALSMAGRNHEAGSLLTDVGEVWRSYPPKPKIELGLAAARVALALSNIQTALSAINAIERQATSKTDAERVKLLKIKALLADGSVLRARDLTDELMASEDLRTRINALYDRVEVDRRLGQIGDVGAIQKLEVYSGYWHGLPEQPAMLDGLGDLQNEAGLPADALDSWKLSLAAQPLSTDARRIAAKMEQVFASAMAGDDVSSAVAADLFDRFRELLPSGAAGETLIDLLIARLNKEQQWDTADSLLQDLIEIERNPMRRSALALRQVKTNLARDRPRLAFAALARVDHEEHGDARKLMEAEINLRLGREDRVLALTEGLQGTEADALRQEALWKLRRWPAFIRLAQSRFDALDGGGRLGDAATRDLVRLAVAYRAVDDGRSLRQLAERVTGRLDEGRHRASFLALTEPPAENTATSELLNASQRLADRVQEAL